MAVVDEDMIRFTKDKETLQPILTLTLAKYMLL